MWIRKAVEAGMRNGRGEYIGNEESRSFDAGGVAAVVLGNRGFWEAQL